MFEALPRQVTIYEVGPRDGLQNEPIPLPTDDKVWLIEALAETGLAAIEMTSFVSPKWIPQLADAQDVVSRVRRKDGIAYSALVPNRRGLDRALESGLPECAVFMSASETHNKKNINKTIAETLLAFHEVIGPARDAGLRVRAYVSTVFGCPYEGAVDPGVVVELCGKLLEAGCYQVSLGDTVGVGNPRQVRDVLRLLESGVGLGKLAVHFHDTRGTALANVTAALDAGVTTIDSALGGLGGCPYAPGASGNVATEDVVYMVEGMGVSTGVDLDRLCEVSRRCGQLLNHELPSRFLKAWLGERVRKIRKA